MIRASNIVRGTPASFIAEFNVLELYSGTIPATGNSPKTGTRLVLWPGTMRWQKGVYPAWVPTRYLDQDYDSRPAEATGTIGYACLRAVPLRLDPSGAIVSPTLATVNLDNSIYSMYLTVGLADSGADIIFSTLDVVEGLPLTALATGSFTFGSG